jgi:UDP-2,3-diacylglucosamine hydrolase
MNDKSSNSGFVVSDLHLFSPCSRHKKLLPEFYTRCSQHSVVVLNGDTFEMKRSKLKSTDKVTDQCTTWLRELCKKNESTQFYYVIGNHDAQRQIMQEINNVAQDVSNLIVIPHILTIGSTLFIHGDVIEPGALEMGVSSVREKYRETTPSKLSLFLATVVTSLRLNSVEYIRHNKSALAATLLSYINRHEPDRLNSIKTIFFGHTHVPFRDFQFEGITFHNTGSFIKGLQWNPMEFTIDGSTH